MSRAAPHAKVATDPADYVGYRGDLLAQLALSRLKSVDVFRPQADGGWDFLVAAPNGATVAVVVEAFSSIKRRWTQVADLPVLRWSLDRALIDRAAASRTPVVLFLFDADTDHGRYLRLDNLKSRGGDGAFTVSLPIEQAINPRSVAALMAELGCGPSTR